MAGRRRTRGTWFPTLGTQLTDESVPLDDEVVSGRSFFHTFPASGSTQGIVTLLTPLTFDRPFEGDEVSPVTDSLSDIVGSEYILQRIVGKIFIERSIKLQGIDTDIFPAILVTAGFFVARANDASVGGGADTPIGSATEPERRDNYSPLDIDNIREPWIWRRTWILGNAGNQTSLSDPSSFNRAQGYPASTALYGSVADGPHIDSRVKRRVSQDNRLFFAVSTTLYPLSDTFNPQSGTVMTLAGYLDYRIFASLRKAKNSSAF